MNTPEIRLLSLWQPWATLIAIRAKRIETRGWPTNYRGLVAIHAAKRWNREQMELCQQEPFAGALKLSVPVRDAATGFIATSQTMPLGAILCVCRLAACFSTDGCVVGGPERAFGNYGPSRFGFGLADLRPLRQPMPYKGQQGMPRLPEDVSAKILANLS